MDAVADVTVARSGVMMEMERSSAELSSFRDGLRRVTSHLKPMRREAGG